MRFTTYIVIGSIAFACVTAMAISVYPGVLNSLVWRAFLKVVLLIPIAGVVAFTVLIVLGLRGKLSLISIPTRPFAIALVIVIGTYITLKLYVPRRIAFAISRSAFEEALPDVTTNSGGPFSRRLGAYHVDESVADNAGGVYFRTLHCSHGLAPEMISFGFAYRPNRNESPFGSEDYRIHRLSDEWYWFRVIDSY